MVVKCRNRLLCLKVDFKILPERIPRVETSSCVTEKRFIALNMESVEIPLKCDMMANLNAKNDDQCVR